MKYARMIKDTVENNEMVLFMKGTAQQPLCGFSARAVNILNQLRVIFLDVNIMEDHPTIALELRELYGWPTSPQLFVRGKLIGGSDIMAEMYQTGELQKLLNPDFALTTRKTN